MSDPIIINRIRTPDGTILCSKNRHDYVNYVDKNGHTYMVDGSRDYLRRNVCEEAPYEELSVYTSSPHSEIREVFVWGKGTARHLEWVLLKDISDDHIQAILDTQTHITDWVRNLFKDEQQYRKTNNGI